MLQPSRAARISRYKNYRVATPASCYKDNHGIRTRSIIPTIFLQRDSTVLCITAKPPRHQSVAGQSQYNPTSNDLKSNYASFNFFTSCPMASLTTPQVTHNVSDSSLHTDTAIPRSGKVPKAA